MKMVLLGSALRFINAMHKFFVLPAEREGEGSKLGALGGGAPQTPAGGLRPPALPAQRLALRLDKFYQGPVNAF